MDSQKVQLVASAIVDALAADIALASELKRAALKHHSEACGRSHEELLPVFFGFLTVASVPSLQSEYQRTSNGRRHLPRRGGRRELDAFAYPLLVPVLRVSEPLRRELAAQVSHAVVSWAQNNQIVLGFELRGCVVGARCPQAQNVAHLEQRDALVVLDQLAAWKTASISGECHRAETSRTGRAAALSRSVSCAFGCLVSHAPTLAVGRSTRWRARQIAMDARVSQPSRTESSLLTLVQATRPVGILGVRQSRQAV